MFNLNYKPSHLRISEVADFSGAFEVEQEYGSAEGLSNEYAIGLETSCGR